MKAGWGEGREGNQARSDQTFQRRRKRAVNGVVGFAGSNNEKKPGDLSPGSDSSMCTCRRYFTGVMFAMVERSWREHRAPDIFRGSYNIQRHLLANGWPPNARKRIFNLNF